LGIFTARVNGLDNPSNKSFKVPEEAQHTVSAHYAPFAAVACADIAPTSSGRMMESS